MTSNKLHIKNMVCPRCVMVVRQILEDLKIDYHQITLGEIELKNSINESARIKFSENLEKVGFSLIDDRKSRIIDQMKMLVIDRIHHPSEDSHFKWTELISESLHYDYKYLSTLFSSVEGITLEQYIIRQKIERIKELMIYDELTLTQIAYQLKYSSVAHLSGQFKQFTGMTPSQFKRAIDHNRQGLDAING